MIDYKLITDKQIELTVNSFTDEFLSLLKESKSLYYEAGGYSLACHYSGTNRLESDFGQTVIYISDKWEPQTVSLWGYDQEDIDNFKTRFESVSKPKFTKPEKKEDLVTYTKELEKYTLTLESKLKSKEVKV